MTTKSTQAKVTRLVKALQAVPSRKYPAAPDVYYSKGALYATCGIYLVKVSGIDYVLGSVPSDAYVQNGSKTDSLASFCESMRKRGCVTQIQGIFDPAQLRKAFRPFEAIGAPVSICQVEAPTYDGRHRSMRQSDSPLYLSGFVVLEGKTELTIEAWLMPERR